VTAISAPSFLAGARGKLTLALLAEIGFLDFTDTSVVRIAVPDIRRDLNFSVQDLQWMLSGYLLTYGGALGAWAGVAATAGNVGVPVDTVGEFAAVAQQT
jgi:hypothetical protein